MLLKQALLNILVKLADDFDRAGNEEAAGMVDSMIGKLNSEEPLSPSFTVLMLTPLCLMEKI